MKSRCPSFTFFLGLGILVCSPTAVFAQQPFRRADPTAESSNVSPFRIKKLINYSRRRWLQNSESIDVPLGSTWEKLRIEPGLFDDCSTGRCQAKIFTGELDGMPGKETILKITTIDFCRYLVFTSTHGTWQFLGHIDHEFNKYEMSRHRIVSALGRSWLVVRGQEGSGSGYALYAETWYVVNSRGVNAVLYYPIEGNTYPWPTGLGRKFKGTVLPSREKNKVVVRYTVTYSSLDYINSEFRIVAVNHHRMQYIWSRRQQRFIFDRSRSNLTEREIDGVANIESDEAPETGKRIGNTTFYSLSESKAFVGGGYEVFLKYNLGRLRRIAGGKNEMKRNWLRQLLKDCSETSEKRELEAILRQ